MRALIVGLGSIGRRHLANLRMIEPDADITVWHQHLKHTDTADELPQANRVVYSLEDALDARPDVALIASPASLHVETGLDLARKEIHLMVEKPLSNRLNGVEALLDICQQRNVTLMIGYNWRFYKPLQIMRQALLDERIGHVMALRAEMGQFLPEWRPTSDYRKGVSARRDLGGGVVLELSHALDYARWLMGEVATVSAQVGHLSDLEIDVEDTAEIVLGFRSGAIGSVHLDMTQQPATHSCRVMGTRGTLIWDGTSHSVRLFSSSTKTWSELHSSKEIVRNEMFIAELRHFLECVRGQAVPIVSGEDGLRVLQIAIAAKQSSQTQQFMAP